MHANQLEIAISFLIQHKTQSSGNTFAEQYYIMHILKTEANHFLLCNNCTQTLTQIWHAKLLLTDQIADSSN